MAELTLTREVRTAVLGVLLQRAETVTELEAAFAVADKHAGEIAREVRPPRCEGATR